MTWTPTNEAERAAVVALCVEVTGIFTQHADETIRERAERIVPFTSASTMDWLEPS